MSLLATLAAMVATVVSVALSVYTAGSSRNSSTSRRNSSSRNSSSASSNSSVCNSLNAHFCIDTVKSSFYGQNIAALTNVINSPWASMQAVTAANFWLLANRDNLLLYAEPLDQLLEPLHWHVVHTSFLDQAALWMATVGGLTMGGIAALGKAAFDNAVS